MAPGTISRIRLENFMCHSSLHIELGEHVNFITGQNGSTARKPYPIPSLFPFLAGPLTIDAPFSSSVAAVAQAGRAQSLRLSASPSAAAPRTPSAPHPSRTSSRPGAAMQPLLLISVTMEKMRSSLKYMGM
ncbi:hypothetical protein HU200_000341 [Digitaria exilis]|uniref:Rad50/SbcC-type AAA domain-containing protein n=1 Tax=Digitaria exilis TaxID=1010633 RepID=A0A835G357_9POAL|nr:hypothetical protein HU200_000341 [Digitaria exilis]